MPLDENYNNSYLRDKAAYTKLDQTKEWVKKAQQELKQLTRDKEDALVKKQRAIEDGDKATEQAAEAEINRLEAAINRGTLSLIKVKDIIQKSEEKVNNYIEELNKDPEFESHVNSILEKRYNRKLQKAKYEKGQIDALLDLCNNHPSLANNLKGMIRAKEETEKLLDELKTLDPVNDKEKIDEIKNKKIPEFEKKKETNKNAFMDFCTKNNINIDEKFLNTLVTERQNKKDGEKDFSFAHNKTTGEINLSKTFKNISKGYDKRIDLYQKSIEKIPGARVYVQDPIGTIHSSGSYNPSLSSSGSSANLPAEKLKWWQFIKRFKAWREVKKADKDLSSDPTKVLPKLDPKEEPPKESKKFRDSYKYDVVRDAVEKREHEIEKQVKEDRDQSR